MQGKFKIELNKIFSVKQRVTSDDKEVPLRQSPFKAASSFLNFDADRIEFEIKLEKNEISIKNKEIFIEKINTRKELSHRELPILRDEVITENDSNILRLHGGFRDVLLNLFALQKKQFKLVVEYSEDKMKFKAVFTVMIPLIEPQKAWNTTNAFTPVFMPEEVENGLLLQLFKKKFTLKIDSSAEESDLRCRLSEYIDASTHAKFTCFNFLEMFQRMLTIEDCFNLKEMEGFSLTFQNVKQFRSLNSTLRDKIEKQMMFLMCQRVMNGILHKTFVIEATKMMPPETQDFDYVYLTDMQDYQQYKEDLHEINDQRIVGKIYFIFHNLILIQLTNKKKRENRRRPLTPFIDEDRRYHVEFVPNRIAVRVAHRAVEDAINNRLMSYLRDFTEPPRMELDDKQPITKLNWMNSSIRGNMEQRRAIKNIINRTAFPSPYVIFGPPGTGKSTTIIEAIAQIVKLKPKSHILVTASSNSACDDIGNRLLRYVSKNKILRIYSPALEKKPEKVDKNLEPISNFRFRRLCACNKRSCPQGIACVDPAYEEFCTARVIIATLVSCGRIVSAGVKKDHFDYIFIDEAAADSEPFTLIPISGLGTSQKGVHAQIVLSGDHKQLGAIVRERFCQKLGMEKSMMERIMETNEKYQRNPSYNENYVTQLVQNFRSHPAILQFSNENFYDSQLIPKCPPQISSFALGWNHLINKNFPVLFYSTHSPSKPSGTSLTNPGEISQIDVYIHDLLRFGINGNKVEETDIGVISPYRAQRDLITAQLQGNFPKIEIGTVDSFQGREMKIIIISTVRSQTTHVGFLRNEKRLNVALTRAKSLLIIVGNAATLQKCHIWNKFIAYCFENNAINGDCRSLKTDILNDENYKGSEKKPEGVEDEYDC